jgi:periplasmic copper chaperone A
MSTVFFIRASLCAGLILGLFASVPAAAAEPVNVRHAWVRAPVAGQPVVGAYLELESPRDAALVGVETPLAGRVELHSMSMDGGVMKMRQVPRIDLPANKPVKLSPGGLHLMLFGVKEPVKPGSSVSLTLIIETAEGTRSTVRVDAEVRTAAPAIQHAH